MGACSRKLHRTVLERVQGVVRPHGVEAALDIATHNHPKVDLLRRGKRFARIPFSGSPKDMDSCAREVARDARRILVGG